MAKKGKAKPTVTQGPRLKEKYNKEIIPSLQKELALGNRMQVPGLDKVVVNMGVGEGAHEAKQLDAAIAELTLITGQKPQLRRARKSVAAFKIREGVPVGCRVTLRGNQMYWFLDRLLSIAIPRIRDFRGLSVKSFDGTGNYSFGVDEQLIFPEIDYDKVDRPRGMDFTIVTSTGDDAKAHALLTKLGFPFKAGKLRSKN